MEAVAVDCEPGGALDIAAFQRALRAESGRNVIVALTCGTTVKGAHDDIAAAMACLNEAGFDRQRRFVHIDGALNAMVLPFVDEAPAAIQPTFSHGFDSLSTSGHKMIGTPMPCGALVVRRAHVERIASAIAYLRSNDTTLMGSRNGHAVLALWARLIGHGREGFAVDTRRCLVGAARLAASLRSAGVPVLRNSHSLTIVFPQPSEDIVLRYQLACHRGEAHAIIMPNVTAKLIDRFAADYLGWWNHRS
jgi:histidine decarboxylase